MLLIGPKTDVISRKKKVSPKLQRYFPPKSSDLRKKKGLRNFNGFSGQNQVIFKKKRFSPKFQRFFRPKSSDLQKKNLLWNFIALSGRNQAVRIRLRWAFHFSMSFGWAPSRAYKPRIIVPPLPSLSEALDLDIHGAPYADKVVVMSWNVNSTRC